MGVNGRSPQGYRYKVGVCVCVCEMYGVISSEAQRNSLIFISRFLSLTRSTYQDGGTSRSFVRINCTVPCIPVFLLKCLRKKTSGTVF